MRQFKRKQKLVATLMAATALLGGKTAPPAAAMSQGLKKITANEKIGVPKWAKYLMIGGASVVGAAAIAGTLWWSLKDKNKDPQVPDEKSKDSIQQNDNKAKMKAIINGKPKWKNIVLSTVKEEDEKAEEGSGYGKSIEKIQEPELYKKIEKEKEKEEIKEDNLEFDEEIEEEKKRQEQEEAKKREEEEREKQKLEQQENKNAFYEKVKDIHPLAEAMDSVINWGNYNKKDAIDRNNGFNATYRPLQDNIEDYGKTVRIKNVGKCQNQQLKDLIKNKVGNDIDKDVHYVITLNDNNWNVVLFGDDKVAIYELNDIFYFYKYQAKN